MPILVKLQNNQNSNQIPDNGRRYTCICCIVCTIYLHIRKLTCRLCQTEMSTPEGRNGKPESICVICNELAMLHQVKSKKWEGELPRTSPPPGWDRCQELGRSHSVLGFWKCMWWLHQLITDVGIIMRSLWKDDVSGPKVGGCRRKPLENLLPFQVSHINTDQEQEA